MEQDKLQQLYALMQEGIFPSDIQGTCQIQLVNSPENRSAFFSFYDGVLKFDDYSASFPDVVVRISEDTLAEIFQQLETFDLRDNKLLSQVSVEGDIDLANFLFSAIKRTPQEILTRIKETTSKCKGFKDSVNQVERIHNPSKDELFDLMNKSVPFLVTGLLENWEFLQFSIDEIKQKYGKVKLRVKSNRKETAYETLNDFIGQMENKSQVYTQGCDLPVVMRSKFNLPYFEWKHVNPPLLWMGSKTGEKPCTWLHRDCHSGLLTNIFGRKRVVLYSPEQSDYLYPVGAFNMFQNCSIRNVEQVNLDQFPLFRHAKSIEVTVGPAESLIIPGLWYHCVYALDDVFSVSHGIHWKAWETSKAGVV